MERFQKIDSSSQPPAEAASRVEQEKQVRAWLRKILKKDVICCRMNEKAFIALCKLMTLQEAAEADALHQIEVLKARSKFFNEKAENIEAGLRAGKLAPDQLPEEVRSKIEHMAHLATLLDCHDMDVESAIEKYKGLCQEREELRVKQSKLQADVENLKQLTHTMEQHLLDVANEDLHATAADEKRKLEKWQRHEMRYRSRVTQLKEPLDYSKKLEELTNMFSISEKLHGLELQLKDVENELPTLDLPADEDYIKVALDSVTKRCEQLEEAFSNNLAKERAKEEQELMWPDRGSSS
ncbi:uncharacterized protein LOC119437553 isoform X2 [Dermacentor silvarum]|uniref:uncharacterized protein LOC119437553 isoform X2 n=1 Tax=Dermacentor silvarum TaxID=543639 RepID=UPI00189A327D|nr:uncharacterized protein LOC119437553 isoform X2 [Dermacentor silvarum]XP_049516656.1 uncharacterized protein LOC119437553 isoform X2 [Dermacentor silvarum]